VPYVPNDIIFEVDDVKGEITLTLGEWIREGLENATKALQCQSGTKRSIKLILRDLESCSLAPYIHQVATNAELFNRAVAAVPEPLQNLINQYIRTDLIALGLPPILAGPGKHRNPYSHDGSVFRES
jgi:hypothetical protein